MPPLGIILKAGGSVGKAPASGTALPRMKRHAAVSLQVLRVRCHRCRDTKELRREYPVGELRDIVSKIAPDRPANAGGCRVAVGILGNCVMHGK